MKKYSALTLIIALVVCIAQAAAPRGGKENEANRLAREGADASKSQDYDKAVDLLRKATDLDHKYAGDLAAVYQQRGYASASQQRYQDAINDFDAALKLKPNDVRIYEQRAAVEMKLEEYDKALADYSEAIKLKPNDVKYYAYRSYIYELNGDLKNSMADTDKVLKLDPNNAEAKARKARLEQREASSLELTPPPSASPKASRKASPKHRHKP
jgi:tetratricopeptide (TPR) repeat protein